MIDGNCSPMGSAGCTDKLHIAVESENLPLAFAT
jgi:hypothetical protein